MLTEEIVSKKTQEMFDIIDWYEQICLDNSFNDIQTLTQQHGLLSALSVTAARKMRLVSKEFRENHALRRTRCAKRQTELQESTDPFTTKTYTAAKAESVALTENQEVYMKEYKAQGEWEGGEIVLRQVNQVTFAMFQHLSELKKNRDLPERTEGDTH